MIVSEYARAAGSRSCRLQEAQRDELEDKLKLSDKALTLVLRNNMDIFSKFETLMENLAQAQVEIVGYPEDVTPEYIQDFKHNLCEAKSIMDKLYADMLCKK